MSNTLRHELISKLKEMTLNLGRTPTRREFVSAHGHTFETFGLWSTFVQAAGLEPSKKIKITNRIFEKDIQKALESFRESKSTPSDWVFERSLDEFILVIGDVHAPFTDLGAVSYILLMAERFKDKLKYIVFMGDIFDMFSKSKFPKSMNIYTPRDEMRLAKELIQDFVSKLKAIVPHAKILILMGNHDIRPVKRVLENAPELEDAVESYMKTLFTFEGAITNHDYRQEIIIGTYLFHHGYMSGLGKHMRHHLMNVVSAHTHHGGCVYMNIRDPINPRLNRVICEVNAGFIGDHESKAMSYTATKHHTQTLGLTLIDDLGERFIAMNR